MSVQENLLKITPRESVGGSSAKKIRKEGLIPAIVYGGESVKPIAFNSREFSLLLNEISENSIVTLLDGKKKTKVLIKDYEYDIISDSVTHLDFLEFNEKTPVTVNIPIRLNGVPVGVRDGGLQENRLSTLKVRCLSKHIPEIIELEIGHLIIGQAIHVKDLPEVKNVSFLSSPERTIVTVTHTRETKQDSLEGGETAEAAGESESDE